MMSIFIIQNHHIQPPMEYTLGICLKYVKKKERKSFLKKSNTDSSVFAQSRTIFFVESDITLFITISSTVVLHLISKQRLRGTAVHAMLQQQMHFYISVFDKIFKCISPNCKTYFCKLQNALD